MSRLIKTIIALFAAASLLFVAGCSNSVDDDIFTENYRDSLPCTDCN